MNQDQEEIRKNGSNKLIQLNVTSLNVPGDGHPGNEMQEIAKENHYGKGITANSVTEGSQVSARSLVGGESINPGTAQIVSEKKTVEAPTKTENLDLSSYIKKPVDTQDNKQTMPETTPEISGNALVVEEKSLAMELAKSIDGELLINPSANEKDIESDSMVLEEEQGTSRLDDFMNTKTDQLNNKEVVLEDTETVFDNADFDKQVEDIASIRKVVVETNKLLTAKEIEIDKVKRSVGVLGVGSDATTALNGELTEYEEKLAEEKNKLQDALNELQKLIQAKPGTLALLEKNSEAIAIPEIKSILDSEVDTTSGVEAEVIEPEEVPSKDKEIKSVEAVIYADGHPGSGLARSIKEAIGKLNPELSNEDLTKAVGRVFGKFTEGILKELKGAGGQSNKDVVNEYRDMVQALEISNGIIEVILNKDGEMSAHIKDNASEAAISTGAADDYDWQMAA